MNIAELAQALEVLIDNGGMSILEATDALCTIALGKAEHLLTAWNDPQAARVMTRQANILEHAAYNMRGIK